MLPLNVMRINWYGFRNAADTQRVIARYPNLNRLFDYLEMFYLNRQGRGFPPAMWNVHRRDMDERTNNAVEGFNAKWNRRVGTRHPNIWSFIKFLKDQQVSTEQLGERLVRGEPGAPRRKKWRRLERRIQRLKERLTGNVGRRQRLTVDQHWEAVTYAVRDFT